MEQSDKDILSCSQCPYVVGDVYQRDCAYPDCVKTDCANMVLRAISEITQVEIKKIALDSVLASVPLNMDSLDIVELAIAIETHASIKIDPDWFDGIVTISDVILKLQLMVGE